MVAHGRTKLTRKFNGHLYVRVYVTRNETLAQQVKHNVRGQGNYALIIHSGPNIQVWARKGREERKYVRT